MFADHLDPSKPDRSLATGVIVACLFIIFIATSATVIANPPRTMIHYYDEVLPQQLLEAQPGNTYCVQLPVREPVLFYQLVNFLTYQPEFICFDTNAEANTWMQENMPGR